ncbi:MAG TPA: class I SAM-dependent methyltransferase [Edaphocola sp.]|nr:class I SAM-dependent methyltransferase [Edaphocola sp.]
MKKPDYGIDAPGVIRNLLLIGVVLLLIAFILPLLWPGNISALLSGTAFWPGFWLALTGLVMLLYAKWGKFRHREKILSCHDWKGNEQVLDVGTGLGLLMIGAAKKLTDGSAYGIDIFNASDLSNNNRQQLMSNASLEQVKEKICFSEQDIRKTNFDSNFFDIILSNLCLHNISGKACRRKACMEIKRMLKPGGKAIISDFLHTGTYKKHFQELAMRVKRKGPYFWGIIPPLFIVIAEKPIIKS